MPPHRPRFSIVTAVYNVEPYLPDFIRSVEEQTFDPGEIEVVAVDDGSTDGSLAILEAWSRRAHGRVVVHHEENAGQAAARNLGLRHATGEWVTFTDPDDMLGRSFFAVADAFARAHPGVEVMASNVWLLDDASGKLRNGHPRRWQFAAGNRVANLEHEPNVFTGSATVSLFRLGRIRKAGLAFDTELRPMFEDGHFACRYLLTLDQPSVGLLATARYVYRKRKTGDSTLHRSFEHPGRYSTVFERGFLDLVSRARAGGGSVPAWLQQVIVYELSWYLSENDAISSRLAIPPQLDERFQALFAETTLALDPEVLRRHRVRQLKASWLDLLVHGYHDQRWHSSVVVRAAMDTSMDLQRVTYRYTDEQPAEEIRLDGRPVVPAFAKTMALAYFGRTRLFERILWLPRGEGTSVLLDGSQMGIEERLVTRGFVAEPDPPRRRPKGLLDRARVVAAPRRRLRDLVRRLRRAAWRLAAATWHRRQFADAWVLMDRLDDADDNGERLFEYLRRERPEINAWFVIRGGTPDWKRLRAAGETRLVGYGTRRWKTLMLNASWLLSSHADHAIIRPKPVLDIVPEPTWKFAFLQHGVIKDDLSPWLNGRELDLFVVSTEAELASVVGDGTSYQFTSKETRLTGLPRFDRLLTKGRETPADRARLLIVAPTWRRWLTRPLDSRSLRRDLQTDFWESDYIHRWTDILRSPEIADAIRSHSWRLGFMPHPNLQEVLADLDLPAHVEPLTFTDNDVQGLYAQCALLVTDYSSVAFNTAVLDRPVVYYQFDRDLVMGGAHVGRKGYFEYERDGFGPVVTDHKSAVAAVVASIEAGPHPAPEYLERIARTFPNRDGRCCERVVAAVEELSRPWVPPGPGRV